MARAICLLLAPEDGIWGVLAASSLAAVLLAVLALSLDLAAAASARTVGQAALDAALRAAANDVVPKTIASTAPAISQRAAALDFSADLATLMPKPLQAAVSTGPTVSGGQLSAAIVVTAPLPAVLGSIRIPLQGKVALGWLPH